LGFERQLNMSSYLAAVKIILIYFITSIACYTFYLQDKPDTDTEFFPSQVQLGKENTEFGSGYFIFTIFLLSIKSPVSIL